MEKTVVVIMWFFIITGAIIVTKICLWEIDQKDITNILVGTMILLATWFTLGYEAIKTIKKILNK